MDDELEATLKNVIEQTTLKWVFVGGKGGVGKTTCSTSLAVLLTKVRSKVLIISTDPAHNLSDAFGQQFTGEPTIVNGFDNLFAMEIDPNLMTNKFSLGNDNMAIHKIISSLPGNDEIMSFFEIIRQLQATTFDVVVFDTAPTGHTLQLLHLPELAFKLSENFGSKFQEFSGMMQQFQQMAPMLGVPVTANQNLSLENFEVIQKLIETTWKEFTNPDLTTFVCVCVPEFLSVYETERLIQDLIEHDIDTRNVLVNHVLIPESDCNSNLFIKRTEMQQKYISQIHDLYGGDFHIVQLPLLEREIRGVKDISAFSQMLVDPTILAEGKHWTLLENKD